MSAGSEQDDLRAQLEQLRARWRAADVFGRCNAAVRSANAADRAEAWRRFVPWTPKGRPRKLPAEESRFWSALERAGVAGEVARAWLRDRSKRRCELVYRLVDREKKAFEAEQARLLGAIVPRPGDRWHAVDERSGSSYHMQGFGANGYARAAAESRADALRACGIEVIVCEAMPIYYGQIAPKSPTREYVVNARCEPVDYDAAMARPADLVEWVRSCWARGVNPRVYNPFLPYEFEKQHGLDYFGGKREKQL